MRIWKPKSLWTLILCCLPLSLAFGQPAGKEYPRNELPVFKKNWIAEEFYRNKTVAMFPWYFGIIPQVYFDPDPAFAPHEETVSEQQFFFTSGTTVYTVNPRLSSKGYLGNMTGKDAKVGFDVSSNGSLMPQTIGNTQYNNRVFMVGPK